MCSALARSSAVDRIGSLAASRPAPQRPSSAGGSGRGRRDGVSAVRDLSSALASGRADPPCLGRSQRARVRRDDAVRPAARRPRRAGTGTDASPYFRVFNPITQGKKFDPAGDYVRQWVPELRHLVDAGVHEPWQHEDGYRRGYPRRLIDHAAERADALERYRVARS